MSGALKTVVLYGLFVSLFLSEEEVNTIPEALSCLKAHYIK